MADTHLLAWSPNIERIEKFAALRDDVLKGKQKNRWSVGKIKYIRPGSRFFMIRLGMPPKGIPGQGLGTRVTQEVGCSGRVLFGP